MYNYENPLNGFPELPENSLDDEVVIHKGEINFIKSCGANLVAQVEQLKQETDRLKNENQDLRDKYTLSEKSRLQQSQSLQPPPVTSNFQHFTYAQSDSGTSVSQFQKNLTSGQLINNYNSFSQGILGLTNSNNNNLNSAISFVGIAGDGQSYTIEAHEAKRLTLIDEIKNLRQQANLEKTTVEAKKIDLDQNSVISSQTNYPHTTWNRYRVAQQCATNLENELENARLEYRKMMSEFSDRLKSEARRLGTCVERAKPLFESQRNMRHFQSEVQSLSIQYRKSQNLKETAKSMVKVAEHNMNNCAKKDANENVGEVSKWLEELNECNLNFQVANDTASTLSSSHSKAAAEYKHWEKKTQILEKTSASKYLDQSRSYFNLQLDFWNKLEQKGAQMVRIETSLAEARVQQSQMLANISTLDSRTSSRNDADSKISSKRSEVNIDDIDTVGMKFLDRELICANFISNVSLANLSSNTEA